MRIQRRIPALMLWIAPVVFSAACQGQYRSMTGEGNNEGDPTMGMTGSVLLRGPSGANYADGIGQMRHGPNPRAVSNAVGQHIADGNEMGATSFLWQWGQFIDHDIALILEGTTEPMMIPVPKGDPVFDPGNTGNMAIGPVFRSTYVGGEGSPREHASALSHFIDGSMVYGSDDERAHALRAHVDGKLKTSPGDFLPYNTGGLENIPDNRPTLFLAGDVRCNEQVGLTSMHTLFVREHNWWAERIKKEHPEWDDDAIYHHARKMVGAEISMITYEEWLPLLLGSYAPERYSGYKPGVDPSIRTEFSSAAYRIGHTLLNDELKRYDAAGNVFMGGHLSLREAFFTINEVTRPGGLDAILRGLAMQEANTVDTRVIDGVRNFLFRILFPQGLDLLSINIQRARDHGLWPYNDIREAYGLGRVSSFSEITSDPQLIAALASVYSDVDEIDPWVGLMAEDHAPGCMMGPTVATILRDQFTRLRDGDRYYMYNDPAITEAERSELSVTRLSDIIRRNTGAKNIQRNVFLMAERNCSADCDTDNQLTFFDFLCFFNAYNAQMPAGDCDGDGEFTLYDYYCFQESFLVGCE